MSLLDKSDLGLMKGEDGIQEAGCFVTAEHLSG
jgi:hypothetical protein